MIILGVNSVYHETSAALVMNGEIVAAAEEERFNRIKHGKPAHVDNADELPVQAIDFCLKKAGIEADDLDAVCYSFAPWIRRENFRVDMFSEPGNWGDESGEEVFLASLEKVPATLSTILSRDIGNIFQWVPHHLAHAASAYYPSGFDEAAILVVDGIGEQATALMCYGQGREITCLSEVPYPASLGFLWEKLSKFLGFSEYDACKVMGLAGYGNPSSFKGAFESFVQLTKDGFLIQPEVLQFRQEKFDGLQRWLGKSRNNNEPIEKQHSDIAATLQEYTNEIMLALARNLHQLCPVSSLCVAGGVALNCTSNWILKEQGPFQNLYIPPAPHDAGTAIGAALYFHKNHDFVDEAIGNRRSRFTNTAYWGPEFSEEQIAAAIQKAGVKAKRVHDIASEAATLVAQGKIVGWFQGRMEFGPRALGNRSLIADPRDSNTREKLNRQVKHREPFRPFAPSVLEERCAEWFEIGKPSKSLSYMLYACPVRDDKASLVPAVLHIDGTARLQVVSKEENPLYHRMISCFETLTETPLVLNTSFNDSEPIVCSPDDALNTFNNTEIDALAIGNYMVERRN
jgi:carbamoyltransferase